MSVVFYGLNAAMMIFIVFLALLAGNGAGSLAFRKTVSGMSQSAAFQVKLLAALGGLIGIKIALFIAFGFDNWIPGWAGLLQFALFVILSGVAAAALSVPRLLAVSRMRPADPSEEANRTKRRIAAETELVVPVQILAAGALLYTAGAMMPAALSIAREPLAAIPAFLCTAGLLLWRQSARRRHIHRDDGTSVLHAIRRYGIYTSALALLVYGMLYTVASAKSEAPRYERYARSGYDHTARSRFMPENARASNRHSPENEHHAKYDRSS